MSVTNGPVAPIRVLLVASPGRGRSTIERILVDQPGMEVIDEPPCRGVERLVLLGRTEPDVLVVNSGSGRVPGGCSQVLGVYPGLTILAVGSDRREVTLHRLTVESLTVPTSSESVADSIRAAVQR